VTVDLEPFTVLIGKNDTGKSSFLDAIAAFTNTSKEMNWENSVRYGGGAREAMLVIELECAGEDYALTTTLPQPAPARHQGQQVLQIVPHSRYAPPPTPAPSPRAGRLTSQQQPNPHDYRKPQSPQLQKFIDQLSAQRYGPYRLDVQKMRAPYPIGGPYARTPLPSDGSGLVSIVERLPFSRMGQLQQNFLSRIPTVKEVRADPIGERTGEKELRFELSSGGIVRANRISDGVLLLLAYATIVNDEYSPAVLMVEEPENGIHPKQLREVLRMLYSLTQRKDPIQVILTTHSPYVLDSVPPSSVRVFRRDAKTGDVEVLPFAELEPIKEMLEGGFTLGEAWYNADEDELNKEPQDAGRRNQ
jgi:predicted ATPase